MITVKYQFASASVNGGTVRDALAAARAHIVLPPDGSIRVERGGESIQLCSAVGDGDTLLVSKSLAEKG